MQQSRRSTPYPSTWEIPVAAGMAVVLVLVLAAHAARALANLLAGAGWTFTPQAELFTTLPALLAGDARAGLPAGPGATPTLLHTCLVLVEADRHHPHGVGGPGRDAPVGPGTGARHGHPRPKRTPCSVPAGSAGSRRSSAPTCTPPGCLDCDGWSHARWGGGSGSPTNRAAAHLWVPWDRTAGVIGPQGSGKTLDLLIPALLAAPGAALVTLTKADDLLLSIGHRSTGNRPCVVLDPFGLAPGLPELVWDPVAGCVDPMVAEKRAKAFTAGTISGAGARGQGDDAARFYAAEAAKVIQGYFHAAALTGRTLDDVLRWVANPVAASEPTEILREHPHAAPFWHGLLHGALRGDDRTAGNTITTVQQALGLFFQQAIRTRCVPGPGRPATNIADVITAGGTIYLLGRESPYESASPLMTAVAEHVLDTALHLAAAVTARAAVPADARLPGRAAVDRTATDPADPDGQRTRPRCLVHLGRADPRPAHPDLRRPPSPRRPRPDQHPGHVRRLQGRRVQPGDLRPPRTRPGRPHHLAARPRRPVRHRRGHPHPHRRRSPTAPRTPRPRRRRERQTPHRPPHPLHRRQGRAGPARRPTTDPPPTGRQPPPAGRP